MVTKSFINSFNRLYRTRCWPAAEGHWHHQKEPRWQTDHHVRLEPQRWPRRDLFRCVFKMMFRHIKSLSSLVQTFPTWPCRPATPCVSSTWVMVSCHVSCTSAQVTWALGCLSISPAMHFSPTWSRTSQDSRLGQHPFPNLFCVCVCALLHLMCFFNSVSSAWRLCSHSGRCSHLHQPHRTSQSSGGSVKDRLLVSTFSAWFQTRASSSVWILQLQREIRPFPKLKILRNVEIIDDFRAEDFEICDYNPHPAIKMQMAV